MTIDEKKDKAEKTIEHEAVKTETKIKKTEKTKKPKKESVVKKKSTHAKHHEKKEPMGNIIYTIPLRKSVKKPLRKRANYSISLIKDFLKMHTKTSDIRLGKKLNEYVWSRGRKNFPRKVRVHVIRDGSVVKAELVGYEYITFTAKKKQERAKGLMDKMKARATPKELQKQSEEDLIEGKKPVVEKKEEAKVEEAKTEPEKT